MAIRELNVHRGWFTADSPYLVPPHGAASASLLLDRSSCSSPTLPCTLGAAPVPYASLSVKPMGSQLPPFPSSTVHDQQGRGSRGRERERESERVSSDKREMYEHHTRREPHTDKRGFICKGVVNGTRGGVAFLSSFDMALSRFSRLR